MSLGNFGEHIGGGAWLPLSLSHDGEYNGIYQANRPVPIEVRRFININSRL